MKLYEPDVCPHQTTDNRGSSKTTSRTFCLQCTTLYNIYFRDPAAGKHEKNTVLKEMDTKSTPAIIDASRRWVSQEDMQLTKEEALICVERLGGYVEQMSEKIKPTELINALQDAIDVLTQRSASKGSALMVTHKGLMPIYKGPAIKTLRRGHHSRSRCLSHPGRRTQRCMPQLDVERERRVLWSKDLAPEVSGFGKAPIITKPRFRFPFNIHCGPMRHTVAGVLDSQELGHDGFVPLLLSRTCVTQHVTVT